MVLAPVFSPKWLGGLRVRNRFIRTATFEGMCYSNGRPTPALPRMYSALARGKVGMVVSGCALVDPYGRHHARMLSLMSDFQRPGILTLADACHDGGAAFCVQLIHAGVMAKPMLSSLNLEYPDRMSVSKIERVIASFVNAARRAYEGGADAVELHAAGSYLLAHFISREHNHREDEFGRDREGRVLIIRRIVSEMRKVLPHYFPILIKVNGARRGPIGVAPLDAIGAAQAAEDAGADGVEILSGVLPADGKADLDYYWAMRHAVGLPIISSGAFRNLAEMNKAIGRNMVDFIGLSRSLIREPDLVRKFMASESVAPTCIRCNGCFKRTSVQGRPLACVLEPGGRTERGLSIM